MAYFRGLLRRFVRGWRKQRNPETWGPQDRGLTLCNCLFAACRNLKSAPHRLSVLAFHMRGVTKCFTRRLCTTVKYFCINCGLLAHAAVCYSLMLCLSFPILQFPEAAVRTSECRRRWQAVRSLPFALCPSRTGCELQSRGFGVARRCQTARRSVSSLDLEPATNSVRAVSNAPFPQ